ncbi:MAG: OmpA family protein [Erythrobacter sp.]|jgi:outer membrane protein OmpA-like peptidoglycan-associated protein|nr:OmpA family protein [Erythrobacter sp.]
MSLNFRTSLFVTAMVTAAAPVAVAAQDYDTQQTRISTMTNETGDQDILVRGQIPADLEGLPEGPDLDGFISGREGAEVRVTSPEGVQNLVALSTATRISASGGFLGLDRNRLPMTDLVNGLPIEVKTVQWNNRLIATNVKLKTRDLKTARMIQTGTEQRFAVNEAATEALRGRFADIDQYNVAQVTNVYFDVNEAELSPDARATLCDAAQQAQQNDNAQLLVVGYTDSTGSYELNQELSERRAARVKNYLQQQCGWQPFRMLTPTGMAYADPVADNSTEYGKAQNRRVAVNVLVSKSAEGL